MFSYLIGMGINIKSNIITIHKDRLNFEKELRDQERKKELQFVSNSVELLIFKDVASLPEDVKNAVIWLSRIANND